MLVADQDILKKPSRSEIRGTREKYMAEALETER